MRIVERPARRKDGRASRWRLLATITLLAAGSPLFAGLITTELPQIESILRDPLGPIVFSSPIVQALNLAAIVIGGLMFAFSKDGPRRMLAGIFLVVGTAMEASNFFMPLFF
jgi:hypothetical protein